MPTLVLNIKRLKFYGTKYSLLKNQLRKLSIGVNLKLIQTTSKKVKNTNCLLSKYGQGNKKRMHMIGLYI